MALGIVLLSSCQKEKNELNYLPCKTDKESNWGMVGPDGQMLFDDEFENQPSAVMNGLFYVKENNGYSVYAAEAKPRLIGDLEGLADVGFLSEGVIAASRKGERISFFDKDGNQQFTLEPIKGKEITSVSGYFMDERATILNEDGECGVIDAKGNVIVEPKYAWVSRYSGGFAIAKPMEYADSMKNVTYELIDKKGEVITKIEGYDSPFPYDYKWNPSYGFIAAKKGDRWGIINKEGEFSKLPSKVAWISNLNKKYVIFKSDDSKFGVMTHDGEIVVRAKYKSIDFATDDTFVCESDSEKWYIVNNKDERTAEIEDITDISQYTERSAGLNYSTGFELIGHDKTDYYLFKNNGEKVTKTEYYEIGASMLNAFSWVFTDYFNATAAAKKLVSKVTDNGYADVTLGSPLYKYFSGSPKDYTATDRYEIPDLKGGFRYGIWGIAFSDNDIAISTPVYRTERYYWTSYQVFDHYSYSWNQKALCDYINVGISAESKDCYQELKSGAIAALKEKGFNVMTDEDAYALLQKGETVALLRTLGYHEEKLIFQMLLMTSTYWEKDGKEDIEYTIECYNEIIGKKDNNSAEIVDGEYDVVVEEVAVEEVAE